MEIHNKNNLVGLIKRDEWMMEILRVVKGLNLPDWWVCAGFVRSEVRYGIPFMDIETELQYQTLMLFILIH
jgi:hypothetical protein